MSVIVILIIIGIVVAGGFLGGFIWAVKSGQYDDTYSPAVRMLFEDTKNTEEATNNKTQDTATNDIEIKLDTNK